MSENTGVKDLMPQIEAKFEQPPVKLQSKYEMDMMNANMKIEQNQQELQKVQQKIAEIQQKSEELTKVRETQ